MNDTTAHLAIVSTPNVRTVKNAYIGVTNEECVCINSSSLTSGASVDVIECQLVLKPTQKKKEGAPLTDAIDIYNNLVIQCVFSQSKLAI